MYICVYILQKKDSVVVVTESLICRVFYYLSEFNYNTVSLFSVVLILR